MYNRQLMQNDARKRITRDILLWDRELPPRGQQSRSRKRLEFHYSTHVIMNDSTNPLYPLVVIEGDCMLI